MSEKLTSEICDAFREGDDRAFDAVFLEYNLRVRLFIAKIVHSHDDAEELCQDVFVKLWENRESIVSVQKISSYLFSIARNYAIDFLRRKKVHQAYVSEKQHIGETSVAADDQLEDQYLEFLIDLTLAALPERQQKIFRLSHEGLSNQEIADKLNISTKTVENSLSMTRNVFRKVVYVHAVIPAAAGIIARIFM